MPHQLPFLLVREWLEGVLLCIASRRRPEPLIMGGKRRGRVAIAWKLQMLQGQATRPQRAFSSQAANMEGAKCVPPNANPAVCVLCAPKLLPRLLLLCLRRSRL
jgi:hypothetical protein